MKAARMLGNRIQQVANSKGLSISDLSDILCTQEHMVLSLIKGRAYVSFSQMKNLSEALGTTIEDLLKGDNESYSSSVVHCMNNFDNEDNREKILDIIDGYIDIVDSLN